MGGGFPYPTTILYIKGAFCEIGHENNNQLYAYKSRIIGIVKNRMDMIKSEPGFTLSARQPMCQNMLVLLPSNLTLAYTSNQQPINLFPFWKGSKSICPWLPLWPNCPDLSNMSGFTVHLKLLLTWLQSWMCPRERGRKSLLDPIIFDGNPEISNDHQPEQLEEDCR